MKNSFLLVALFCVFQTTSAQSLNLYKPTVHVAVEEGAHTMSAPFCGGFNVPQFSGADLNNDGKPDLVSYEGPIVGRESIRTFLNNGTAGNPFYEYAPQYEALFPQVFNHLILRDYNGDGIADLFTQQTAGISVYKGYFAGGKLQFQYLKDLEYESNPGIFDITYVNSNDVPGIEDVDGDGDLDFLCYSIAGSRILYYKNLQKENGLPNDTIRLTVDVGCWGGTYQNIPRTLRLGDTPQLCNKVFLWNPNGNTGGREEVPSHPSQLKSALHGNNALCLLDMEGDGDMDYLNGNASYSDIQFVKNGRVEYNWPRDTMVSQDTLWQSAGTIYRQRTYPAAFRLDFNNDGKRDILIAPHGGGGRDRNQIWYYQNNGTATAPQFVLTTDSLLSNDVMDIGSHSRPLFYDYNKDGKPDLLVGGLEMLSNGQQLSRLHYYENITTTVGQPRFQFRTLDLVGLDVLSVYATELAVGDADGDGLDDLVIGGSDGKLIYFRNNATSAAAQPIWMLQELPMTRNGTDLISVFSDASPAFYDINKDGKPDLVIGRKDGALTAYLNTNTASGVVSFGPAIDSLGGAFIPDFGSTPRPFRNSRPFIGKLQEGSNKDYLLMGNHYGALYVWDNVETGSVAQPFSLVADTFSNLVFPPEAAPAVADVDGDGKLEMVVGTDIGGLQLFWTGAGVGVAEERHNANAFRTFPNPAKNAFEIRWEGSSAAAVSVMDITGRVFYQETWPAGKTTETIATQSWPTGIYLLRVVSGEGVETAKIQVLH